MQEKFKSLLIAANPHYYDYFHFLKFKHDTVEFADGAGQVINTIAFGKFVIHEIEPLLAELEFYDIVEVNPYQRNEKIRDIAPFKVRCRQEVGTFAFWQEVVWHIPNEEDYLCLISHERFVFDSDPLAFGLENQQHNLYYQIEKKDFSKSLRFYYADGEMQKLTLKEVLALGITREMLTRTSAEI